MKIDYKVGIPSHTHTRQDDKQLLKDSFFLSHSIEVLELLAAAAVLQTTSRFSLFFFLMHFSLNENAENNAQPPTLCKAVSSLGVRDYIVMRYCHFH